tara:strand:- start:1049 stop:1321 length:273 start_codon:yes stop_codon:yes gene_type:complete
MSNDIGSGLLMIGVTNTILLDGQGAIELLFINTKDGNEVNLPVTEEQAEFLLQQVDFGGSGSATNSLEEPDNSANGTESAWRETDKTPQL